MPQRYVPRYVQQAYSSTHKILLAMVLSRILQWWWLSFSSGVCLGGVGVGRRLLATVVAETWRSFCILDLLGFYL
jgi:hypothetical protein